MDNKDLELLEFPRIREMLAGYCSFSISHEAALVIMPSNDTDVVRARLEECAEARRLLEAEPSISVFGLEDVTASVMAAARGKILDTGGLATVRRTLEVLRVLRAGITRQAKEIPRLAAACVSIQSFASLEKTINQAVSPEGELLPNASEKLAGIRHSQRTRKAELVEKLQAFISADNQRRYIQEPIVTEREGRFVIAVKNESRNEIKGIVHDVSNTGATLFIEPWQTLEMGNALKELQIAETREIERILSEISVEVGKVAEEIVKGMEAAAFMDLALAKARFARRWHAIEADVFQPVENQSVFIKLLGARHPLLGDAAVPLDIELGRDYKILIITGPNTGGKTVALKTVGLLCLMTQAGIPIPAATGSRLPVLDGVYADIGDEQSIQGTLSTFGWHMSNISRILKSAHGHCLILLDELGASTDPQEGAALGRAILLHLLSRGILAAVTTHYSELKLFAHVTEGLQNASFDFNPHTLTPNYHLTLGTPGGSNAIATAEHFGLPAEVITQARAALSQNAQHMERLLANLQAEKQRLEDLNTDLEQEKQSFISQNRELGNELAKLKKEKHQIIQQARDNIVEEVAQLEKELKQAAAALKKEHSNAALDSARQTSNKVRESLKSDKWQLTDEVPGKAEDKIGVGDNIWLNNYGVEAQVVTVNLENGQIEAAAGAVHFKVLLEEVTRLETAGKPLKTAVRIYPVAQRATLELDLRGRRAEEIEPLLDRYLSDAALDNLKEVRIIHGFGTGVVRSIVREIAAQHPLVRAFKSTAATEGGDGATLIQLK
jgi:DNA mismatch repair protein MutS2